MICGEPPKACLTVSMTWHHSVHIVYCWRSRHLISPAFPESIDATSLLLVAASFYPLLPFLLNRWNMILKQGEGRSIRRIQGLNCILQSSSVHCISPPDPLLGPDPYASTCISPMARSKSSRAGALQRRVHIDHHDLGRTPHVARAELRHGRRRIGASSHLCGG